MHRLKLEKRLKRKLKLAPRATNTVNYSDVFSALSKGRKIHLTARDAGAVED